MSLNENKPKYKWQYVFAAVALALIICGFFIWWKYGRLPEQNMKGKAVTAGTVKTTDRKDSENTSDDSSEIWKDRKIKWEDVPESETESTTAATETEAQKETKSTAAPRESTTAAATTEAVEQTTETTTEAASTDTPIGPEAEAP